jgi:hypothetical protein
MNNSVRATEMTLIVDTPNGVLFRRIAAASILPGDVPSGPAAEGATRGAAAYWGLPDFVFRPALRRRGSASREIGDAIVIVGALGASVQVKARQAVSDSEVRERSWLDKSIRKACKQVQGTLRNLKSTPETALVNERGREVVIKGQGMKWIGVVVLDHPGVEGYVPTGEAVVLLRRDWEFLLEQLKSTYAVLEYLQRVSGEHLALGAEPIRYFELAAADSRTPPSPADSRLTPFMTQSTSVPLLPQTPAGHGDDRHHLLVRGVLEDIAVSPVPDGMSQADVLDLLAAIDATPVGYRADLGRMWLSWLRDVAQSGASSIDWHFRGHIWPDRPYLIFGAAPAHTPDIQLAFSLYVGLRHQQHLELMPERLGMLTVGVILTPRSDGVRPWDTTVVAIQGNPDFNDAERAELEHAWGTFGQGVDHVKLEPA